MYHSINPQSCRESITSCQFPINAGAAAALSQPPLPPPSPQDTNSVPLPSPNRQSCQWIKEREPDPFSFHSFRLGLWILVDLGFSSSVIDEVVMTMVLWNRCHWSLPTSTTFDLASVKDQQEFGLSNLLIFFRSWQLVCLLEEIVGWLWTWQSWTLLLVCSTGRPRIFNTLFWWWRIVSLCSLEDSSSRCSFSGF
jgi:hypothetical protein